MPHCPHSEDSVETLFSARDYITGDEFTIVRCTACGLTITRPVPADITKYYPPGYYGDVDGRRFPWFVEAGQSWLYGRRVDWVTAANGGKAGRVLDVGCGRGFLLKRFRERGWDVLGTELSETAAAYPRNVLGLPIHVGELSRLAQPRGSFDAVVLWHVLEHVPDPQPFLSEIAHWLRPGGLLLVGVPNFASWEASWCHEGWFHLDVPRHLIQWTPKSLSEGLLAAGLAPARWSYFAPEYDSFSFVQSLENRMGFRTNLLYELLRGRGAKVIASGRSGRVAAALSFAFAAPLGVASLPATLLAGLCGRGATMTVIARRSTSRTSADSAVNVRSG